MPALEDWFDTAVGRYMLDWERGQFENALADVFGYHAVQIGLGHLDALKANRMPHRWLAATAPWPDPGEPRATLSGDHTPPPSLAVDAVALPFAEASIDLVVLPHTLELSPDPHATLREVHRVLVHEGRVAITGLNPASLWGLRQWRAQLKLPVGRAQPLLPQTNEFISHWRLRDWLRLLQFELESLTFGCWRPAARSERGLARLAWMDRAGARWWPVFGAAYCLVAVKRAHGAKLVGAAWKTSQVAVGAPASIANRAAPAAHNEPSP